MSPLQIQILLHYWACADDYHDGNWTPFVMEVLQHFVGLGLLFDGPTQGPRFQGNMEALRPYVEALQNIPLPVERWVMPEARSA